MLTVHTNSVANAKPDYNSLYRKAFNNTVKQLCEDQDNKQLLMRAIFYGVKYVNTMDKSKVIQQKTVESKLWFIHAIKRMMELLTPAELIRIFPIDKTYDGERYQWKDYFYTMQTINSMGLNEVIGEKLLDLLWDYQNTNISLFLVAILGSTSDMMQLNGQKGIMEQWCEDNGIDTYTQYKDSEGREFIQNNTTGKTAKVKHKIPRYMKLVK